MYRILNNDKENEFFKQIMDSIKVKNLQVHFGKNPFAGFHGAMNLK